jgi:hypothetical protein
MERDVLLTLGKQLNEPGCGDQLVRAIFDPWGTARESTWLDSAAQGPFSLQDAVALNADADPELEVVVLDLDRSHLLDLIGGLLVEVDRAPIDPPAPSTGSILLRQGLLAGDVDGDGLTDLVRVAEDAASIYRAIPHDDPAARACPE